MRSDKCWFWKKNTNAMEIGLTYPYEENYNRIGSYDFSKPQKVEHIDAKCRLTGLQTEMINKINELVDVVNKVLIKE